MTDKMWLEDEEIKKWEECEYRTIRSHEAKCLAESKDIHTCIGNMPKRKCPRYRLKQESNRYKQALKEIKSYCVSCKYGLDIDKIICLINEALEDEK